MAGLVEQLAQGGLAEHVQSWVGNGQNLPVSGEQIAQALGGANVGALAQQLGIDPQQAGTMLSQVLPHIINHFTPNGQLPPAGAASPTSELLTSALGALFNRAT